MNNLYKVFNKASESATKESDMVAMAWALPEGWEDQKFVGLDAQKATVKFIEIPCGISIRGNKNLPSERPLARVYYLRIWLGNVSSKVIPKLQTVKATQMGCKDGHFKGRILGTKDPKCPTCGISLTPFPPQVNEEPWAGIIANIEKIYTERPIQPLGSDPWIPRVLRIDGKVEPTGGDFSRVKDFVLKVPEVNGGWVSKASFISQGLIPNLWTK